MFKNLKLSFKIFTGYIVVLVFLVGLSLGITYIGNKLIVAFDWVEHTAKVIGDGNLLVKLLVDMETGQRGFLITGDDEFLEPYNSGIEQFHTLMEALQVTVNDNKTQVARLKKIDNLQHKWLSEVVEPEIAERRRVTRGEIPMERIIEISQKAAGKKMMDEMRSMLTDFVNIEVNLEKKRENEARGFANLLIWLTIVGTILVIIISITLAFLITTGIVKGLKRSSENLQSYSSSVLKRANLLSVSSERIAEGANEQATQVEETTASVEQLSSMVLNNVQNAKEASDLSDRANKSTEQNYRDMDIMFKSMNEINDSSEEIRKVIKVIDDIAFQTNILALNAAVEAARAGEVGMGFAVVAEEVKNLANKSAEAASDTAEMIEKSIVRSQKGLDIAGGLLKNIKKVSEDSSKVRDMSKEVESASFEQQKGLEQVSKAIIDFDKVVQENVQTAEETAKTSQALNSQAKLINEEVSRLTVMVNGSKGGQVQLNRAANPPSPIRNKRKETTNYLPINNPPQKQQQIHKKGSNKRDMVRPEELIPFENDEEF